VRRRFLSGNKKQSERFAYLLRISLTAVKNKYERIYDADTDKSTRRVGRGKPFSRRDFGS
jgi:hypothetical protein